MEKFVLASVGNAQLIDQLTGELIADSKTLTESGISFSVTAEDIRGGQANALIAQYFHDSAMTLTLTDALFSLEYLALNVGGTIRTGADNAMTVETVTVTTPNTIQVSATPKPVFSFGTIGWYTISGKEDWSKITFVGNTASVADLPVGTSVCVKYAKEDASAETFTVSSAFIPSQVSLMLTLPLFKATTEATYSSSSKVGEIQVQIPNFILSGASELSLTAGGASTTSLSGNALATFGGASCDSNEGYYANLVKIIYNKDEFDGIKNLVIADSDIDLAKTDTQTLEVYGLYGSGIKAPKLISNSKLTFTSSNSATATVGQHTGVVTAVANGTANIEVTVTTASGKTLVAQAVVTVA